jgi:imidazolonepropionase-like amidohydrolase
MNISRHPIPLLAFALLLPRVASADEDDDLAQARALFERNIAAIQNRDPEAYLACYRQDERLVRVGAEGMSFGFEEMKESTPAKDSEDWPDALLAYDLQLSWLGSGQVFGTYRYRVSFDGAWSEGVSERLFSHAADGWHITVTTAHQAPPETAPPPMALTGVTVYDGLGGRPIVNAVVIVRDGRIEAVGRKRKVAIPDGIDVVDLPGRFVTPGLVDTHVHYSQTGWADGRPDVVDVREQHPYAIAMADCQAHPERFHRAFLHSGVTAVFDVGGYPWTRELADQTEAAFDGPHIAATGPLLSTWDPDLGLVDQSQFVLMQDEQGARQAVQAHSAAGSDAIKVWFIVQKPDDIEAFAPLVHAAGEEAAELGMPLVVHATSLETARTAIEAGARLLVHSVEDLPVDEDFVRAAVDGGVFYSPTLTVHDGYLDLFSHRLSESIKTQLASVDPSVRERVLLTTELAPDERFGPESLALIETYFQQRRSVMADNLLQLHQAGVPVVLGTDAGNPLTLHGPSVFGEMEAMQAAGMEPLAVLRAATSDAADAMGRGEDLGVIAPGRVADLLVLQDDPGEDIEHMRSIEHVMRGGVLHARAELAQ